jgi:hypothetical protein
MSKRFHSPQSRRRSQRSTAVAPLLPPRRAQGGGGEPKDRANAFTNFYASRFIAHEVDLITGPASALELDDEIWLQRVMNLRLLEHASPEAEVEQLIKVHHALANGAGRVARLLRDQRALSGAASEGIVKAISQALDEIGSEIGDVL